MVFPSLAVQCEKKKWLMMSNSRTEILTSEFYLSSRMISMTQDDSLNRETMTGDEAARSLPRSQRMSFITE